MLSESPPRNKNEHNNIPIENMHFRCRLSRIGVWLVVSQDSV